MVKELKKFFSFITLNTRGCLKNVHSSWVEPGPQVPYFYRSSSLFADVYRTIFMSFLFL
jgi:hypothetical protein